MEVNTASAALTGRARGTEMREGAPGDSCRVYNVRAWSSVFFFSFDARVAVATRSRCKSGHRINVWMFPSRGSVSID